MRDDGPSPEDLERFSDETGFCPHCGAEVWDGLSICPQCGLAMSGGPRRNPPTTNALQRRWVQLVVILALLAFLFVYVAAMRPLG
jgi:hypothetical protein